MGDLACGMHIAQLLAIPLTPAHTQTHTHTPHSFPGASLYRQAHTHLTDRDEKGRIEAN